MDNYSYYLSLGAKPVFIDIDKNFNLDPTKIEQAVNKKTKAIVPMHVGANFVMKKFVILQNIN